jgi:hypothetical protein
LPACRIESLISLRLALAAFVLAPIFLLSGCDPIINVMGANFPAWLLCVIAGIAGAAAIRPVFLAARIEGYLGPLVIVYPCLALLLSCVVWIFFFNRI